MPTLDFSHLTTEQRLDLIGELWDSIAAEDVPLSVAQEAELAAALDWYRRQASRRALSNPFGPLLPGLRGILSIPGSPPRQTPGRYSAAGFLANQGVPVSIDAPPGIAHNKVAIIDGEVVVGAASTGASRRRRGTSRTSPSPATAPSQPRIRGGEMGE